MAQTRLRAGVRIGPYEVLAELGAGGMGDVYRARDPRLGRDVAIKVLPPLFLSDPERRARFEREARALAALNHPNIAVIHGIEDAEGAPALILELIDGVTLAERLAHPIPVTEALTIARQIADALEAAHDKGIVHRDLKPANIKITSVGVVKVLDFGLAKVYAPDGEGPDLSHAPTVTAGGTRDGMILGTPAYMSPEQARGKSFDKRTDIWTFGCVLYEMLTGRVPFPGETMSDTIAAILEHEPDWRALPAQTPASTRRLLQRCLEKDPKRRLRDIGDARMEVDEALAAQAAGASAGIEGRAARDPSKPFARPLRLGWWAAGAGLLAIGAAAVWSMQPPGGSARNPLDGAAFTRLTDFEGSEQHAAISRDGKFVVFVSDRDGAWDAWVGQIGTGDFHNLTKGGVPDLRNPNVRNVGFTPDGSLVTLWVRLTDPAKGVSIDGWAVPTMGGQRRPYLDTVAELDWTPDGRRLVYHPAAAGDPMFVTEPDEKTGRQIYVSTTPGVHCHYPLWSLDSAFIYFVQGFVPDEMDIWRIPATGGEPARLTFHDSRVSFPTWLDGRTLLYLATADDGSGPWIHSLDVESGVSRRVSAGVEEYASLAGSANGRRLVATVMSSAAGLWRAAIDGSVIDESRATRVSLPTARGLSPRLGSKSVIYRAPRAGTDGIWKLTTGQTPTELWSGVDGRVVAGPAVAPDGRRLAFPVQRRGRTQLYVMNVDGSGVRPLAEELDVRGAPAWSPDGQWIAIAANRGGQPQLHKVPIGEGAPIPLVEEYSIDPIWSPTGRFLVYSGADVATIFSVKAVNADGTPHALPKLTLSRGSRRLSFLAGDDTLVLLKGDISHKDFWALDLQSGRERQLSNLGRELIIGDFDVSADGREIIFDRARDESDIVLIDLPER
jgi:Tol biopolymer transport system component